MDLREAGTLIGFGMVSIWLDDLLYAVLKGVGWIKRHQDADVAKVTNQHSRHVRSHKRGSRV